MARKEIEISLKETKHQVAREYAVVFDNGLVQLRRSVRQKLTDNEVDNPNSSLTIEQIGELAKQLEAYRKAR